MYADEITPSMDEAIKETERRRKIQEEYNKKHNITPKTIIKKVSDVLEISSKDIYGKNRNYTKVSKSEKERLIKNLTKEMKLAAQMLEFEHAAFLRDEIEKMKKL